MVEIRKARLTDVKDMHAIIAHHSEKNKLLSRSLSYIYENLRDYFVAEDDGEIIGCCALHISWADLAEVKSLAVAEKWIGKGVGKALLEATKEEARQLGLESVFTLTLEPEFFAKHGFKKISREDLPMKVWGECIHCPKYPNCDESALVYEVS